MNTETSNNNVSTKETKTMKASKCDSCKHQNWYAGKRCCNYEGFIKKEPIESCYNYKYSKEVDDFYKAYYKTIKQHPDTDFYKYSWFLANNKFLSHKQERSKNMKAKKQDVSKTIEQKNKNGLEMLSYGEESIKENEVKACNDADDYDEAFEYEYYKPNQNYPVKLSGKEIKDISAQVCKHIFGLVSDSDGNLDIEGVNTARAIVVCAAESMKSLFEDFAEDLAEDYWTKKFVKKPKFKEGMVVEFPIDRETGNKKQGVIVEANDDGTYAVFLGHTTLGGLTEPILYDMLGIEKYKK